jgi:hypothetical protein
LFYGYFYCKESTRSGFYHLNTAPVMAIAIMILPIIDTLNVIIISLAEKRSPFDADKNHIHHKLLKLGIHTNATLYIISYYLFIVIISYFLRHIEVNLLVDHNSFLGFLGAYLPIFTIKRKLIIKYYLCQSIKIQ